MHAVNRHYNLFPILSTSYFNFNRYNNWSCVEKQILVMSFLWTCSRGKHESVQEVAIAAGVIGALCISMVSFMSYWIVEPRTMSKTTLHKWQLLDMWFLSLNHSFYAHWPKGLGGSVQSGNTFSYQLTILLSSTQLIQGNSTWVRISLSGHGHGWLVLTRLGY
jgi:hypothetical protein